MTELKGQIEQVSYFDEASGFTVARMRIPGRPSPVTVVGRLLDPRPGEVLSMSGEWVVHRTFGEQFKVIEFKPEVPTTEKSILKYLGSGLIRGLGEQMAGRIVARFGSETLKVIENDIERLEEVRGIGRKRLASIRKAWEEQKEVRQLMLFLQAHDIPTGKALRIFKRYGNDAIRVLRRNPYRLAVDIPGIGFKTADRMARQMGFPADSPLRAEAGVLHAMRESADQGHVYLPRQALMPRVAEMLAVPSDSVHAAADRLIEQRRLVAESLVVSRSDTPHDTMVYLPRLNQAERGVADLLDRLMTAPAAIDLEDADAAVAWARQRTPVNLVAGQLAAIRAAITGKVMVITGGPGTGKTTIIQAILSIFNRRRAAIHLAAPTGRAAKRMAEASGRKASTIHRLLEYSIQKGGFQRNPDAPLKTDLVIVDEASMIDTPLMAHLLGGIPRSARLILVGDVHQLPSVGPGNILGDIIASGVVPVAELTDIHRQARSSRIVTSAHAINRGRLPDLAAAAGNSDFYFVDRSDPEQARDTIVHLVAERIPGKFGFDPIDDIQVLTPMHRGAAGADELNRALQAALNPRGAEIVRGGRIFRLNDKVMQIRNNYDKEVFNGDVGRISAIDVGDHRIDVTYDGRIVSYESGELDEMTSAYAVSVHKSQGSEFPAVVIPVLTQHYVLLKRNLIYTAITRGRQLVVLVGTRKALAMAVARNDQHVRYTGLCRRLTACCGKGGRHAHGKGTTR
jgi:exodeoxyribonuclease V alpha subunit